MSNKTVRTLQLSNLSEQTKEKVYVKLLKGFYDMQVTIDIGRNKRDLYNIDVEFMNNDCCLSSWTLNFYTRTNKAVRKERYKTLGNCLAALKKLAKKRHIKIISNLRIYKRVYFRHDDGKKDFYDCHLFSIQL